MKVLSINKRVKGNPVIPRNPSDPAHQFGNVKRSKSQLTKRYNFIARALRELVKQQKTVQTLVTNIAFYEYEIDSS